MFIRAKNTLDLFYARDGLKKTKQNKHQMPNNHVRFLLWKNWLFQSLMAVFILEDALCIWTNLGKHSLFVWLFVPSVETGARRIIRLDELSSVVRPERRTTEESSSRRIMCLVPVFTLETNNQTNNECLPKFVETHNASSNIKTTIVWALRFDCIVFAARPQIIPFFCGFGQTHADFLTLLWSRFFRMRYCLSSSLKLSCADDSFDEWGKQRSDSFKTKNTNKYMREQLHY